MHINTRTFFVSVLIFTVDFKVYLSLLPALHHLAIDTKICINGKNESSSRYDTFIYFICVVNWCVFLFVLLMFFSFVSMLHSFDSGNVNLCDFVWNFNKIHAVMAQHVYLKQWKNVLKQRSSKSRSNQLKKGKKMIVKENLNSTTLTSIRSNFMYTHIFTCA